MASESAGVYPSAGDDRQSARVCDWLLPLIVVEPTPIPNLKDIVTGACGPDHSIVIDKNGKAYSWGFSANYQTGQGTDDDIDVPTMIDNTAVRETKLTWAGCGGQYSVLASKKE